MLLFEGLDRVYLLVLSHLAQNDFAVGARAYDLDQVKVVNTEAAVRDLG